MDKFNYRDFLFRFEDFDAYDPEKAIKNIDAKIHWSGEATVSDLYDFLGIDSSKSDILYGWKSIKGSQIIKKGNMWILHMPKPIKL